MPEETETTTKTRDPSDCEQQFVRLELPLVKVRKSHQCRLCGEEIKPGEYVYSWTNLISGEGWRSTHVHPECYSVTANWDSGDWECAAIGDVDRPKNVSFIPA